MENLLLGIKGHIVCLKKHSGKKVWATKLKSTSGITNVYLDGEYVYAYSGGHLFCLAVKDGQIKWENTLEGLGYGPCIIASDNQNASSVAAHVVAQQSSAIAASAGAAASASNSTS